MALWEKVRVQVACKSHSHRDPVVYTRGVKALRPTPSSPNVHSQASPGVQTPGRRPACTRCVPDMEVLF